MYILSAKDKPSISGGNIAYCELCALESVLSQFIFQVATFSNIISDKFFYEFYKFL